MSLYNHITLLDPVSNGGVYAKKESNHKTNVSGKINIVETTPHVLAEDNSEKENKNKPAQTNNSKETTILSLLNSL